MCSNEDPNEDEKLITDSADSAVWLPEEHPDRLGIFFLQKYRGRAKKRKLLLLAEVMHFFSLYSCLQLAHPVEHE